MKTGDGIAKDTGSLLDNQRDPTRATRRGRSFHPCMRYFGCRTVILAAAVAGAPLALGCRDDAGVGTLFAVRGRITLDNEPLTAKSTVVLFKPDESTDNDNPFEPVGTVDGQGNYTMFTEGKEGAPPGWYRVIVTATEARQDRAKRPPNQRPIPRSLLPAKYGQAATTDLMIEVVENPAMGAYDLRLASEPET